MSDTLTDVLTAGNDASGLDAVNFGTVAAGFVEVNSSLLVDVPALSLTVASSFVTADDPTGVGQIQVFFSAGGVDQWHVGMDVPDGKFDFFSSILGATVLGLFDGSQATPAGVVSTFDFTCLASVHMPALPTGTSEPGGLVAGDLWVCTSGPAQAICGGTSGLLCVKQ